MLLTGPMNGLISPNPAGRNDSDFVRLEREETKLWRAALFFVALLAVGLGASAWNNLTAFSTRYGLLPIGAVALAIAFAFYAGKKRSEIAGLRAQLHTIQQVSTAPATEEQLDSLAQTILRSQKGYRDLLDSFDDVVLAISMDGEIQAANRAFAEILGLQFSSFVYHPVKDFIEQPTGAEVQQFLPRLLEHRHWAGQIEVKFRNESRLRIFECSLRPILKEDRVSGISIWGSEITGQRERETRFTDLFETLHEGAYFTTPDGHLLDANQALINMLGFQTKAELQAVGIENLYVDPKQRKARLAEIDRRGLLLDCEIRLRRKDGREIVCLDSSHAIFDEQGHVARYQGTLVDITQRRAMEAQLGEQQEFNRRLIECFPDAILVLDHELRYTFASPRIREVLGWDPEEIVGKTVAISTEQPEPARLYRDVLSGVERVGNIEYNVQNRSGHWCTLRCTASPLTGHDNEIVGVVASLRDVTITKQIEQQLVQAERLAAMGQMIDGFAHELNNPLTAIMGAIDLLETNQDATSKKHLKLLKEQSRRAVEVVQNLLFFSRPPARGTSRLNLNDLIQRTILLHQYSLRMNGISIDLLPEPGLPLFEGDASQLMQVFLNLLINAEQAIRSVRERGTIRVRLGNAESHLWVSFQDDGPGIAESVLQNIFDPFYSTKRPGGGTGMGLSVALGIVKQYGGNIDFQTAPGTGAVFTVSLPLQPQSRPEMANTALS